MAGLGRGHGGRQNGATCLEIGKSCIKTTNQRHHHHQQRGNRGVDGEPGIRKEGWVKGKKPGIVGSAAVAAVCVASAQLQRA
jgi:hypothetical protein